MDKLPVVPANTILRDEEMPFENVCFFSSCVKNGIFFPNLIFVEIEIICDANLNAIKN